MTKKITALLSLSLSLLLGPAANAEASGLRKLSDIAYGSHKDQTLDVYIPANANNAPVIFMVHGGAWKYGDKASRSVVKNKMERWTSKGFIFISSNYRLLPDARAIRQAHDVAKAIAFAQRNSQNWGGAGSKFILIGHSAGAHLVSLISSSTDIKTSHAIKPWLGTVAIDSAAYNIVEIMTSKNPPRFYQQAFGDKPSYWQQASPFHLLTEKREPFLAICSLKRKDGSCEKARSHINKSLRYGSKAQLLEVNLSHRKTNIELGKKNNYTTAVEAFMRSLDRGVKGRLSAD